MNTEGFTHDKSYGPCIGKLRNNWRYRFVEVYNHPHDERKVITIGRCMMPRRFSETPAPIVCVESKDDWRKVIDQYPNVVNVD